MIVRLSGALVGALFAFSALSPGDLSAAPQPRHLKHRKAASCRMNPGTNNSFVGIPGASDVAGGAGQVGGSFTKWSAVAGGFGNQACSNYTGVLAGLNNIVGSGDYEDNSTDYSIIGGGEANSIDAFENSFIGAGSGNTMQAGGIPYGSSVEAAIVAGSTNSVAYTNDALIGAGTGNTITSVVGEGLTYANSSFIGGGDGNVIDGGLESAIVGGASNSVTGAGSSVVGGLKNVAGARQDFVGGGYANQITATSAGGANGSALAVIGGGSYNTIASMTMNAGYFGVIGGGSQNMLSGLEATIGGGYANSASGQGASVPGGSKNVAAGVDSFAAGTNSYAKTNGSFVFSDDAAGATQLVASGANVFLVRASGGVAFYSNPGLSAGVVLHAGSGTWASLSDRSAKTNIVELDPEAVLAKVAALPVSEWSYRTEANGIRHVGPMAQDFYATFNIGEDNRHITTIDEDGVALAAIKGLYAEKTSLEKAVTRLAARDAKLEADVAALEARVARNGSR